MDSTGEHGLIAAPLDQGFDIEWGCPTLVGFGAEGLAIGDGAKNTLDIITACSTSGIATDLCDNLDLNGYEDWFLPSKNELDSLYANKEIVNEKALENNGQEFFGGEYWTSSHDLSNTVWNQSFNAGNQIGVLKDSKNYVRAIRAF